MPIDLDKLARELGLEEYPGHPAKGSKAGEKAFQEEKNSPRTWNPALVRQDPSDSSTPPVSGRTPGNAGQAPGEVAGKDLPDEKGPQTPLQGVVPGSPGRVSGSFFGVAWQGSPLLFLEEAGERLGEVLTQLMSRPYLGMDLETTGLDPHTSKPRLLSLAGGGLFVVVDLFRVPLKAFAPLFGKEGPLLVGHNLKFDLTFLLEAEVWQGSGKRLWDVGLAHQVLHAQAHMPALKDLVPMDKTLQTSDWNGPLSKEQIVYSALDAAVPLSLYQEQRERAQNLGLEEVLEVEHRALPTVAWMELMGVPFEPVLWEEAARKAEEEVGRLLSELPSGVNWNSPGQVLRYLKELGLPLENTREESLAEYCDHPLVAQLLAYREATKQVNTYGKAWAKYLNPATERIHPSWQQIGAATGRMACRKPNLQQVPRNPVLRRAFRPKEGRVILKADFSQIELRIAAVIAGERRMLQALEEGVDLHSLTAAQVLGKAPETITKEDRQLAKALNFGLLYGLGTEGLRRYAKSAYGASLTLEEAERLRQTFFQTYPDLKHWHRSQPEGEVEVRTLLGRRRITDRYTEKLNTPVQGTGADGLKLTLAMLWENRHRLKGAFPVLAVHDELLVESVEETAKENLEILTELMRKAMEEVLRKQVPVEVEGGIYEDWGITPWKTE